MCGLPIARPGAAVFVPPALRSRGIELVQRLVAETVTVQGAREAGLKRYCGLQQAVRVAPLRTRRRCSDHLHAAVAVVSGEAPLTDTGFTAACLSPGTTAAFDNRHRAASGRIVLRAGAGAGPHDEEAERESRESFDDGHDGPPFVYGLDSSPDYSSGRNININTVYT